MTETLWQDILKNLEPQYSRPMFITWLKPTKLVQEGEGLLTITVPNEYAKIWIETNALKKIRSQLEKQFAHIENIRVAVRQNDETVSELPLLELDAAAAKESQPTESQAEPAKKFNPHYTFETFVVGNNNRLAFAAAQAVADRPGTAYNPLFLYGGVGLGKTHLMQAIGNALSVREAKKKISYISCETFTSEFITALQQKSIDQFKKKYRSVDVLLVDDIQFLANKEGTQEEFFHTFNILHQANRQIVITSDRIPKDIPGLEERLISRLGWGMIADIQSPNFETRVAIIQEKAKEKGVMLSSEVANFIANAITSNVRELEGALTKLLAAAELEQTQITLDFARRYLKDLSKNSHQPLSSKKIIQIACQYFQLESADLLGKKRTKELVYPRQIVMFLLRELGHQTYPQIAQNLGGKDHTTVMYGVEKITKLRKLEPKTEEDLTNLEQLLYN